jgi:hypothetical protein
LQAGTAEDLYVQGNSSSTTFALDTAAASADRIIAKSGGIGHACYMQDSTLKNSLCWGGANGDLAVEADGSPTLRNVTAVGGTEAAILLFGRFSDCSCTTATMTLVNVIARSGAGGVDLKGDSDSTANANIAVSYSNYATTLATGTTSMVNFFPGAGNQTIAPSFVDSAAGDFHQAPASVTVDGGLTDPANGTVDLDGAPRTVGSSVDIGAYEATDTTSPQTDTPKAKIKKHKVKLTFGSDEPGSTFECKLDKKPFKSCTSPRTYKHLKPGKHKFKVRAIDAAGNVDPTPAVKKFKIKA